MPKAFPVEFRRDVVAVARKGESSIAQVAKDFGVSESCLQRWLKAADIEEGTAFAPKFDAYGLLPVVVTSARPNSRTSPGSTLPPS